MWQGHDAPKALKSGCHLPSDVQHLNLEPSPFRQNPDLTIRAFVIVTDSRNGAVELEIHHMVHPVTRQQAIACQILTSSHGFEKGLKLMKKCDLLYENTQQVQHAGS
jgi:hypothetical protein